ncbi:GmrSD restriction endonuclease domain-containing protein [Methanosarcina sp. Mfa9]|uniref:GmrSD restriction endonuclease domain-containing protein n=1 Tax=Methanosarcina sp. Mfa9 TaxID=3439063 RepID=UPI003F876269
MSAVTTFDSTKSFLKDILKEITIGKIQLPDFQRGWVWDDERIKSLLASVSLSFPIGAVMMLQTGNAEVRFKPRLIEGLNIDPQPEPEEFILDGQQRLTALYQAILRTEAVETEDIRKKPIKRHYYIDIEKALNPNIDREECIRSIPEDRIVRNFRREPIEDYSIPEHEFESGLFPFNQILDSSDWRMEYDDYWLDQNDYREKRKLFNKFEKEIIKRFEEYQIPLIAMNNSTPKEAVCLVFEKVNTGGVTLTVFELLTATFAADDFNLRDNWKEILNEHLKKHSVLQGIENTDFLQAVCLLATRERRIKKLEEGESEEKAPAVSCKRKEILKLKLDEYTKNAGAVAQGFEKAAKLLNIQNIFTSRDIPYRTQITPLAATLAVLGEEADKDGIRKKIFQWYWCGVLGELYGSAIETRFAKDLLELLDWINGGPEPTTVKEANFDPGRLHTLRTRNSAAYKGIYALLMRDGGIDFRTGDPIDIQTYYEDNIDIHHIFPQDWCRDNGIDRNEYNSIINKTPLSAKTNRIIGGKAPNIYLEKLQKTAGIDEERMDEILETHVIDPDFLRDNDFAGFFKNRKRAILKRIENAMGKSIAYEGEEEADLYGEEETVQNLDLFIEEEI